MTGTTKPEGGSHRTGFAAEAGAPGPGIAVRQDGGVGNQAGNADLDELEQMGDVGRVRIDEQGNVEAADMRAGWTLKGLEPLVPRLSGLDTKGNDRPWEEA